MTYLIFLVFSLGQIGRLSFLGQQVNIYLYELILAVTLISLFFKYGAKPLTRASKKYKEIFIFFGVLLLSFLIGLLFYNIEQSIVAFLYFLRLLFYFVVFFYAAWHIVRHPIYSKQVMTGVFILSLLTVFFTLVQYFFYPDLRNLFYLGWDPHLYRALGTYLDTSVASAIYGLILLFLIIKFNKLKLSRELKIALIIVFSLMSLLTYSRGFYLAMLLTLLVYLLSKKKYLYIFIMILAFSVSLLLLPRKTGEGINLLRTFSIASRIEDNSTAISIWQKKPLLGIGYNRIRYEKEYLGVLTQEDSDLSHSGASFPSSFLIILATGGLFGLISFIWVLSKLASISEFSKYLLIFTSIFSLWDNILLHPFILFLLFALISLEQGVFNYRASSSQ